MTYAAHVARQRGLAMRSPIPTAAALIVTAICKTRQNPPAPNDLFGNLF
jgi:hypothetical protein